MTYSGKLLATAAALGFMSGSAYAADLYVPIEEPFIPEMASLSWNGAYVGVHAGYGWGEVDVVDAGVEDAEIDGWLAGVQAGYNVNLDGMVIGVEGDIAWADINGTYPDGDLTYEAGVNWIGTLRARIGFAAESFLIYGTAGVAFAGVDVTLSDDVEIDADSNTHTGLVAGVGIETMVTEDLSLKVEYLYHEFGDEDYTIEDATAAGSFNVQTIKAGLNWHF